MFRRWVLPLLLILAAGGAGILALALRDRPGARPEGTPEEPGTGAKDPAPPPPSDSRFALLFGGGLEGRLWTPPCSQPRQGGLSRVGPVIAAIAARAGPTVLLDTGDLCGAPGRAGAAEGAAALRVLREAGLAATAVGEKDLLAGLEEWKRLKNEEAGDAKVLCANLRDDEGREIAPAVAHFVLGSRRVLVAAILSPSFEPELRAAGVAVRLVPPAEALQKALEIAGKADYVVLLAHAAPDEARALLREVPRVDAAIAAHGGPLPWLEPEVVDGRLLLYAGTGWQFVCGAGFRGGEGRRPELRDTLKRAVGWTVQPDHLAGLHLDVALRDLRGPEVLEESLAAAAARVPPGIPRYEGPSACLSCHPSAHAKWSGEPHAKSMAAVVEKGFDRVPTCLTCHATAPGRPGGFPDPRGEQAAVTCEACHGPGATHVAAEGRAPLGKARDSCAACHTAEMSPSFTFEEAWKKIEHGK